MTDTDLAGSRYEEMNRGLTNVNVAGAMAITLLTVVSVLGDWWTVGLVLAIQLPVIAFNTIVNLFLVRRFGVHAEIARAVVNVSTNLLVSHIVGWTLPVWLWQAYVALAFDQFGRRTALAIVVSFCLVQDVWALIDGQPLVYALSATAIAVFCWEVSRVRMSLIRDMVAQADRQRLALEQQVAARERVEIELRQAQKLEAIGRLAAGVSHEINTPLQFISDNVSFLRTACESLTTLVLGLADDLRMAARTGVVRPEKDLDRTLLDADFEWLRQNALPALDDVRGGIDRVGAIVGAMRHFAHADRRDMVGADLNDAVRSTLVISRHEYFAVADVEEHLGELPLVLCHVGEINQVILNLVVNAAHAVGERQRTVPGRGRITVRSWREADRVVMSVADTGTGIPESIHDRVFEPFFTTKEVGLGTGQGLAICRSVVQRHGGRLWFETEMGVGTTFFVELPVEAVAVAA